PEGSRTERCYGATARMSAPRSSVTSVSGTPTRQYSANPMRTPELRAASTTMRLATGLFVLTGGAERTGLADAITTSPLAAGLERPAVLTAVTAVLSNLVSNVPAVLMFKPIVPQLAEPTRAWLLVAMASTLSGNLTILGSVANLIVVEAARSSGVRIGFAEYCRVGVPLTLVTLL